MPAYFVWFRERDTNSVIAMRNGQVNQLRSLTMMRAVSAPDEHTIFRFANRLSARGVGSTIVKIQMMVGKQEEVFGEELLQLP
jgi:hypothetical protein